MVAAVSVEGLGKVYGRGRKSVSALDDVSLDVSEGELLVLLGPSGCGKSTMLRCLAGLERPTAGRIAFHGRTVSDAGSGKHLPANKRDIGLVFQTYVLWPHMTVAANVEFPLKARAKRAEPRRERVEEVLQLVDCAHLADRLPAQLSGGQQQRVALARALVSRPELLLLDEPLSNLDALLRLTLRAQLKEIHRTVRYTGVYVTHDQAEALSLADRIAVMENGRIAQVATPRELFEAPASAYVANFLGVRNQIPVTYKGNGTLEADGMTLPVDDGSRFATLDKGEYSVYFRPESAQLRPADDTPRGHLAGPGVVDEVMYGGTGTDYVVSVAGRKVFARTAHPVAQGDPVTVAVAENDLLLYDANRRLVSR